MKTSHQTPYLSDQMLSVFVFVVVFLSVFVAGLCLCLSVCRPKPPVTSDLSKPLFLQCKSHRGTSRYLEVATSRYLELFEDRWFYGMKLVDCLYACLNSKEGKLPEPADFFWVPFLFYKLTSFVKDKHLGGHRTYVRFVSHAFEPSCRAPEEVTWESDRTKILLWGHTCASSRAWRSSEVLRDPPVSIIKSQVPCYLGSLKTIVFTM